jgi:bacteriocin-like protein
MSEAMRELTIEELESVSGGCKPNCGCPRCPNNPDPGPGPVY